MGVVYRAHDSRLGRECRVKVSARRFSERFEREARAVAALNHPNICTLHDVGPDYLVMELVEGETLADVLAQRPRRRRAADRETLRDRAADRDRRSSGARRGDRASRSQAGQHQDRPTARSRCSTSASPKCTARRSQSWHDIDES
jgi:serine/threonine protein kinase